MGTIGIAAVAAAIPNGCTIGYAPHSAVFVIPHLQKLPYHPVVDLKMIMQFGSLNTGVIIRADSPLRLGQLVRRKGEVHPLLRKMAKMPGK